jgi:hypothetical protein
MNSKVSNSAVNPANIREKIEVVLVDYFCRAVRFLFIYLTLPDPNTLFRLPVQFVAGLNAKG